MYGILTRVYLWGRREVHAIIGGWIYFAHMRLLNEILDLLTI